MPARRVSAPTDGRACSEPQDQFPWQIPPSHAEGSCCVPRRSAPGWPRAASCRPSPFPLSTAPSTARSPRRASRARPSRTPTTGASPTGSPRTSTRSGCRRGTCYGSGNSGVGRIYHNSLLLTTHAVAALSGHQGPCRNDERARALARRLCDSPPWSERDASPEGDPQFHNPGWVESMGTRDAAMDKSIDPKVAEALMYAWRARDVLRLPPETVDLIADRISRCARGPFFRFPNVRLNQINWNCELYAHTRHRHRRYRAARERLPRAGGALLRRASPARADSGRLTEPRPRIPLPLPPAPAARRTPSTSTAPSTRARRCHFILYYEQALARRAWPRSRPSRNACCGPGWSTSCAATGPTAAI